MSARTLTSAELDALPVGAAVRCTTERGMRVVLALKVGSPQGAGGHIWRTTEGATHPGSFAIAHAGAVVLEPAEPGPIADAVLVDGDNPALAAADVQAAALTSADQVSDVVNARHTPVVGHSRHDAPRDIPSSAGGPAMTPGPLSTTPSLDRAIEELEQTDLGFEHSRRQIRPIAHRVVSAALHDPDGDVIARTLREHQDVGVLHVGAMCSCLWPGIGQAATAEAFAAHVADAVRAAILGEAS